MGTKKLDGNLLITGNLTDGTNNVAIANIITSHQSIKSLDTTATTSQTTSASETIAGSGTITLHKVSKTGSYDDLNNKPTIPQGTLTSARVQAGTGLSSSQSTAQSTTLDTTISIASGYKLPTTTEWNNCIKNVSISGNTLTITRNNNTTITIELPASSGGGNGGSPSVY